MLMKWLDGKCQFFKEMPLCVLRPVLMCAPSCHVGEAEK